MSFTTIPAGPRKPFAALAREFHLRDMAEAQRLQDRADAEADMAAEAKADPRIVAADISAALCKCEGTEHPECDERFSTDDGFEEAILDAENAAAEAATIEADNDAEFVAWRDGLAEGGR